MAFDVHTGQFRTSWSRAAASIGGRRGSRPPRATTWPDWAVPQLEQAADVAARVTSVNGHPVLAAELYRRWFNPVIGSGVTHRRALAGVYRAAHASSGVRVQRDEVWVVDRHDVVGRDGWWRTWNEGWVPTRSRTEGVRVMFSPQPECVAEFVHVMTDRMREVPSPWLLACATDPARLGRTAAAILYVPSLDDVPSALLDDVAPTLRDATPPLCLPLVAGAALGQSPGNGMSLGEHRCHLVALALRDGAARRDPLAAVAEVFRTHGVDPAHPYRS
jgi:hypothetical protein